MDECLERLIDIIESRVDLKTIIPSERVAALVRIRLELQAPYISTWAQALSAQVQFYLLYWSVLVLCTKVDPSLFVCILLHTSSEIPVKDLNNRRLF